MNNRHISTELPLEHKARRACLLDMQKQGFPLTSPVLEQLQFHLDKAQDNAVMLLGLYCMSLKQVPISLDCLVRNDLFTLIEIHAEVTQSLIPIESVISNMDSLCRKYHEFLLALKQAKRFNTSVLHLLDIIYFTPLVLRNYLTNRSLWAGVDHSLLEHESHCDLEIRFGFDLFDDKEASVVLPVLDDQITLLMKEIKT